MTELSEVTTPDLTSEPVLSWLAVNKSGPAPAGPSLLNPQSPSPHLATTFTVTPVFADHAADAALYEASSPELTHTVIEPAA
jgi:hypothetical protein